MTIINQAGITSTGAGLTIPTAFDLLAMHPDTEAWFNCEDTQRLLGALPWYEKTRSKSRNFSLMDPEIRPLPILDTRPFLGSPTSPGAAFAIPRSTNDLLPATGNWSISFVTSGFASSPQGHAVCLVGDSGHALSIRTGTSSRVEVGIGDASAITDLQVTGLAAGKHLVTLAYDRTANEGTLIVDNTIVATRGLTGFTQQRQDLTILCVYDHTSGPGEGGRGTAINDIHIARTNVADNPAVIELYHAAMLFLHPTLVIA